MKYSRKKLVELNVLILGACSSNFCRMLNEKFRGPNFKWRVDDLMMFTYIPFLSCRNISDKDFVIYNDEKVLVKDYIKEYMERYFAKMLELSNMNLNKEDK